MYLDPGFGSMIIQFVVAGLAACGAYFVIFRKRIAEFFQNRKGASAKSDASDNTKE